MKTNTPRTDAAQFIQHDMTAVVDADFARELERELAQAWKGEEVASRDFRMTLADLGQARRELAAERARVADLVADLNDACITLASAAEDCDDYAMQNTGFKLTAVREVLLQHIPNAAMKEGA